MTATPGPACGRFPVVVLATFGRCGALLAIGAACFPSLDYDRLRPGDGGLDDVLGPDDGTDGGSDAPVLCGNGRVDPGEDCDPDLPGDCLTGCGSTGAEECNSICELVGCIAPSESCNGADDDCDGETNEGYECAAGSSVECTTPCGVIGTAICTDACEVPPTWECRAAAESCNGCDDNRDGTTDEGCPCATDWVVEHPLAPGPESLQAVSIAPGGTGFAVGPGGTILAWDGSAWSVADSPVTYDLRWVHAISSTFAVASGANSAVVWWDGAGWSFDPAPGGLTTATLYGGHAVAEDDVWVAGSGGTALHWDGSAWTRVDTHTTRHLYRVWAWDTDHVYAVGTGGTVIRWDGADWSSIAPAWLTVELESAWGPDADTLYVVGTNGAIARWDRGTGAWTPMTSGTIETLYAVWGSGPDDIWTVGGWNGGTVLHYDGTAWTEDASVPSLDRRGLVAVSGSAAADVFVAARDGGILHWDGAGWRPSEGNVTVSLRAVWGTSPQDVFAVGVATSRGGTTSTAVLRYDGAAWTFPDWLRGVDGRDAWASSPSDVYLVAANGNIPHFTGSRWETLDVGFPGIDVLGLWGPDAGHYFVVGGQRFGDGWPAVFERTATAWRALPARPDPPTADLLAVHGTSADVVFAVGTGGTIVRRAAGEDAVDLLASGTTRTLRAVWVFSDTDAFAVGDDGVILRWDGTAWTSMTSPSDPWDGLRLGGVWGSSPDNVFAVGVLSTVLRFDGIRWTWLPIEILSDLTAVWGSSANNVFAVADDRSGKILHRCGSGW